MESKTGDRLSLPSHALQACEACALRPALFPVILGNFGCDVTCQACRENLHYHTRFQASSGNSDSIRGQRELAWLRGCTSPVSDSLATLNWRKKNPTVQQSDKRGPLMRVYILCTKFEFQNPLFHIFSESKPCPCQCFTTIVFALVSVSFQPPPIFL